MTPQPASSTGRWEQPGPYHMIYVEPAGKRVYTTNVASGTVSILVDSLIKAQSRSKWVCAAGALGLGADSYSVSKVQKAFDVSPDGKELWTAAVTTAR